MTTADDKHIACDMCGDPMRRDQNKNLVCTECPNFVPAEDAWQQD